MNLSEIDEYAINSRMNQMCRVYSEWVTVDGMSHEDALKKVFLSGIDEVVGLRSNRALELREELGALILRLEKSIESDS